MVAKRLPSGAGLRCLHTVGSLSRDAGGPSQTVTALCDALVQMGANVEIVTQDTRRRDPTNSIVTATMARVRVVPAFSFEPFRISYAPGFRRILESLCIDGSVQVLHDNGLWAPSNHATSAAARRFGLPLIVSPHGTLEPWALNHRRWKKRLAWWLYQRRELAAAHVLHATAQQEARNFRRLGLRQAIAVIPNGVVMPATAHREPRQQGMRVALFLSRIHAKKGLLELVEAWRLVKPSGWKVVVAGPDEGGYAGLVKSAVRNAGLESTFEFVGPVEGATKADLYGTADLFLLPSFSENFGVVVAEALACDVPVITTKGTPWQGLEDHRCGWWIDIGVAPLAAAVQVATSLSDEERRDMGRRGRTYVEREFGWPGIAEQMLAVYLWMVGQGTKPNCVVCS